MTFLEGLLSFISPCILPMVPVYLIYFAGESGATKTRTLINAIAFSLGFTIVFVTLGVFAGSIGAALAAHRVIVQLVCAGIIAFLGAAFVFNINIPMPRFKSPLSTSTSTSTSLFNLSTFLFGMTFAVCLTPCVGAFLGAALMTAASEGGAVKGALLLAEYSLGLAIPFILSALMINRLKGLFGFFKAHGRGVSIVSGLLLVGYAGLMAFSTIGGLWKTALSQEPSTFNVQPSTIQPQSKEQPMEITLNSQNFEVEVLKSDKPVIVDFWATWCGPCRMLAPELEALAAEKGDTIKVGKVNVDENPELCARYGIMSIPAIFVFKNGQITAQSVGYQKKSDLAALLEK